MNNTMGVVYSANAMLNLGDWGPIVGIILLSASVLLITTLAMSVTIAEKFRKLLEKLGSYVRYTFYGGLSVGSGYTLYRTGKELGKQVSKIDPKILVFVAGLAVVLPVIGYAAEKIIVKALQNLGISSKSKPKTNRIPRITDIFGDK